MRTRLRQENLKSLLRISSYQAGRTLTASLPTTNPKDTVAGLGLLAMHKTFFERAYKQPLSDMELKSGFVVPPWTEALATITGISPSVEEAVITHDTLIQQPDTLHICTDGSGINGKVGSAGSVCKPRRPVRRIWMLTTSLPSMPAKSTGLSSPSNDHQQRPYLPGLHL
jgi:hypothetical protein